MSRSESESWRDPSLSLADRIVALVVSEPGLTDRELTDRLLGRAIGQQQVNQAARILYARGRIRRDDRSDGLKRNYPASGSAVAPASSRPPVRPGSVVEAELSEDEVKHRLERWLAREGWTSTVAWGRQRGVDIEARNGSSCWRIEVKGCGSLQPMRVNYFLGALGELLQRMDDPDAKYSLAFPDLEQFRGLWQRLPQLAKQRTGITALFVSGTGEISELC